MVEFELNPHRDTKDTIRSLTFVRLRWLAVTGQLAAVIVARGFLGIDLPLGLCLLVVAALALVNIVTLLITAPNERISEGGALLTFLFDILQLGAMLYLTGGLSNPFVVLFLAPVTISATLLSLPSIIIVAAFASMVISFLVYFHLPLRTLEGAVLISPQIFQAGTWSALIVGIMFLAGYARRITTESSEMSEALIATQMALEREQRLTALGGVVAAAAHELGTPLATIKLVASELREEVSDRDDLIEDVELIRSQAERCRDILRDMGERGRDDRLLRTAPVFALVQEAAAPHLSRDKEVFLRIDGRVVGNTLPPMPTIQRRAEVIHGLRNLVQNAVDFAAARVWIDVSWDADMISVHIGDDGPGYPMELLGRIGEPFIGGRSRNTSRSGGRPEYEGMGLGLFIAKTLLERTGATLEFGNVASADGDNADDGLPPEHGEATGATVEVTWPRAFLEVSRDRLNAPLGRNTLNMP